jgi:hypothetical protein
MKISSPKAINWTLKQYGYTSCFVVVAVACLLNYAVCESATAAGQLRADAVWYPATATGQQYAFMHAVWYPATALQ